MYSCLVFVSSGSSGRGGNKRKGENDSGKEGADTFHLHRQAATARKGGRRLTVGASPWSSSPKGGP